MLLPQWMSTWSYHINVLFFFWEKQKHVMLSENYTKSTWMWSDSWDTWTKKGCNGVTKPANKGDHRGLSAFLKPPPTRHHPPFKSISITFHLLPSHWLLSPLFISPNHISNQPHPLHFFLSYSITLSQFLNFT